MHWNSARRTHLALLFLSGCWVLGLGSPAAGQATATDAQPAAGAADGGSSPPAPEPTTPQPIAPAEVTSQATVVSQRLETLGTKIEPSPTVARLALDFSTQTQSLTELRQRLAAIGEATVSTRDIEEQRREWIRLGNQLDGWMQVADDRWKTLQGIRTDLTETRETWELTKGSAQDVELPAEVKSLIDQILQRIDQLQSEVKTRLDQLAEIIARLTNSRESINESLRHLSTISERVNERLLVRDSTPIWQASRVDWLGLNDASKRIATRWVDAFRNFFADNAATVIVHLLILVALTFAALRGRNSVKNWPSDQEEDFRRARFLVAHPYSLAVIFTLLLAEFLYSNMPLLVRDSFYLLLLIPMFRLVPGLSGRTERIVLYSLLSLSLMYYIVGASPDGTLLFRVLMLLTGVFAVAVISFAIARTWASRNRRATGWKTLVLIGSVAALVLFVIALGANVFGWTRLAGFLYENALLTCQGAVLSVLFVRAGQAILPVLTRHGIGRSLLSVRRNTAWVERTGVAVLALLMFSIWLRETAMRFRLATPLQERAESLLATPLQWTGTETTVGDVVRAILILLATLFIQRALAFLLREELLPRIRLGTSSAAVFATLCKYGIVAIGLGMAASALGFSATQLTVVFGALGVGIGFGLQNIVNNFVSGLILMFERPIKIGDIVESDGNWGLVKSIGVRATVIKLFEGAELVVPNGDLLAKELKNWTLSDTVARIDLRVGVAYRSDPRQVIEILLGIANAHELVLEDPQPLCFMTEFGDSSLNFLLLSWTTIDKRGPLASELHMRVFEALGEAGIEIPFPQRDLHVRSIDAPVSEIDRLTRAE